ncbi:MAG: hypothetical protein JXB35_15580 [Anaerolineae bacterium]|nr:hypothetical protein [Anaerolineae bacterium]
MNRKPTDLRGARKRAERTLLISVAVFLVVVGGVLIGLVYGWDKVLPALLCLVPGAGAILVLWLLLSSIDRITRD